MSSARALLTAVMCAATATLWAPDLSAQTGGSVLRVARGATSQNVAVTLNRAVVVESAQKFIEVSVANPAIADVAALSDESIYVLGKAPGRTTLTIFGENGRLITNVDVMVTPDLTEFKQRLSDILPGEPIEVRSANGGIVLSGTVSGARKVARAMELASKYAGENVTNLMNVGGSQQVMLKVRFAEVQRSASKQLGLNVGAVFGGQDYSGRLETNQFLSGDNAPGGAFAGSTGAFAIGGLALQLGDVLVDVILNALEQKGLARSLAEPNLVAQSGDTASFLAGGEVPIPVSGNDGQIDVEFKPFGVALSFTPTVVDGDIINIELETEVSSIDSAIQVTSNGISVPGFQVRRASTTIELRDGQSFAIAGLLRETFVDNVSQVPFLGDVPVLGTLFRSADFNNDQTELVIVVTPQLVVPVDGAAISLPTDRIAIPNEQELFLFGALEGAAGEIADQDFDGDYGYVNQ